MDQDPHNLITLILGCLNAMSQNIASLRHQDKEIYYQEVKKLVELIN